MLIDNLLGNRTRNVSRPFYGFVPQNREVYGSEKKMKNGVVRDGARVPSYKGGKVGARGYGVRTRVYDRILHSVSPSPNPFLGLCPLNHPVIQVLCSEFLNN